MTEDSEISLQKYDKSEAYKRQIENNKAIERQMESSKEKERNQEQILVKQRQDAFNQVVQGCVNEAKEIMKGFSVEFFEQKIPDSIKADYPSDTSNPGCTMKLIPTLDFKHEGSLKVMFKPDSLDFNKIKFSVDLQLMGNKTIGKKEFFLKSGAPPIEKDVIACVRKMLDQARLEYLRIRAEK